MTTNHHTPIAAGESNAVATINSRLADLDAAITGEGGSFFGGNVATLTNGFSAAAQTIVVVDSTVGFVAGGRVAYILASGVLQYNVIDSVDDAVTMTLTTNIGTGGIANNTYISLISEGEYQASVAIQYGNSVVPTLATAMDWASEGVFNVQAYGAIGDGLTDDTVAIQAALDAAAVAGATSQTGGVVVMPPGDYRISAMLTVPGRTMLVGSGFGGALLRASDTFDFDTYPAMIHLGAPATGEPLTYAGAWLENLNIDCNWRPRSIAVRSDGANEACGMRRCRVRFWTSQGVQINAFSTYPNSKNYALYDLDIMASGGDPSQGDGSYVGSIRTYSLSLTNITGTGSVVTVTAANHLLKKGDVVSVTGTTYHNDTYVIGSVPDSDTFTFLSTIANTESSGTLTQEACGLMITGAGGGGVKIDKATVTTASRIWGVAGKYLYAGIILSNVEGSVFNTLHVENSVHGVLIGKPVACQGVTVMGVGASAGGTESTVNLVTINGANQNTVLMSLSKENATNTVNNTRTGQVRTDAYIGAYIAGYINADYVHNTDGSSYRVDTSSTPVSNKTPNKVGELFLSSSTSHFWISTGLTNADWKQITA